MRHITKRLPFSLTFKSTNSGKIGFGAKANWSKLKEVEDDSCSSETPARETAQTASASRVVKAAESNEKAFAARTSANPPKIPMPLKSKISDTSSAESSEETSVVVGPVQLQRQDAPLQKWERIFFRNMQIPKAEARALIANHPSLSEAIRAASPSGTEGGFAVNPPEMLNLFEMLVAAAPELAWRYLFSDKARQILMTYYHNDVKKVLAQANVLLSPDAQTEAHALAAWVAKWVKDREFWNASPAGELTCWMNVLPPSVRSHLKQELIGTLSPDSISAWRKANEELATIWDAS